MTDFFLLNSIILIIFEQKYKNSFDSNKGGG